MPLREPVMDRPRKVMHVLNSAAGGAALSVLSLVKSLAAEGIRSCAVCHDAGTAPERLQLRDAVGGEVLFTPLYWWNRKIRVPLWRRPLSEIRQVVRTGWAFRSTALVTQCAAHWNADLIHTNTILTPEGGLAARRLGLAHVWHLRELVGPGQPFRLPYEGLAFGRYMAAHCSKLVANSHASAELVRPWLGDDLLEVVPNGIDTSRFRPRTAPAQPGKVVVAMIGNLTSRVKKHVLFVDAAARVERALVIDWRIYGHDPSHGGAISGDSYLAALHAHIRATGMAGRIAFPGHVADPAEIMAQVDVVVHPADRESFGRVVVEAMAAGLPVVGVRGGGVGEIVRDGRTGLLAQPDDPVELAAHIERLVRDPALRATFGAAGRRRAEESYSLAACTAGILRVFEQAMARPLARTTASGPRRAVAGTKV
jgi:glycosyltransferase involved in cell wall biosynthesis